MKDQYRPLLEFGFDEAMAAAYLALVSVGRATIKELQAAAQPADNWSYSQAYHILRKLLRVGAAERQKGLEDTYTPLSPAQLFEQLRARKWERYAQLEQELTDSYERATEQSGACTAQVNHFYFSSLELGFKILADRFIGEAQSALQFIAPPPSLLKHLEWAIVKAYERGVTIEVHYSPWDFEELPEYFGVIKDSCRRYHVKVTRRQYRTHSPLAINDAYTRVGTILIDRRTLITVPFYRAGRSHTRTAQTNKAASAGVAANLEYGIDFIEGFCQASGIVQGILDQLCENPIQEEIHLVPAQEAHVLELVQVNAPLSKHDLAVRLNVAGSELKVLLGRLERQGLIHVERVPQGRGKGRPADVVTAR